MKKIEISILQSELNRLNNLLMFADKKIAFIFILYSIFFWFYFKNIDKILITLKDKCNILILFLIILLFISWFIFIYLVIFPKIKNSNIKPLLFFWYIANFKLKEFKKEILSLNNIEFSNEILEQIHTISNILNFKMLFINYSIKILIWISFLSVIFFSINFNLIF